MEHWVEVYVTLHRDRGDESTISDYCRWEGLPETIGKLSQELLDGYEPVGRAYPTFRVRFLSVPNRMLRYLRPKEMVR